MFVIRPIASKDEQALLGFALAAELGLTNLPKDRDLIHKKILRSVSSFAKDVKKPEDELYLFVLEDVNNSNVVGTCAIYGKTRNAYFYHLKNFHPKSTLLEVPQSIPLLHPVCYSETPSEVCGLYLMPSLRKEGLGKLLSLSRFLFIAAHETRFSPIIISEIRGQIDEKGQSPFWNGLGSHFLQRKLEDAIDILIHHKELVPEFLPKHPIYVSLLSQEAQDAIGTAHMNTKGALKMLEQEGFSFAGEVDVFDGGPKMKAQTREIQTIKKKKQAHVAEIRQEPIQGERVILSNISLDFRACYGQLLLLDDSQVVLSADVAQALQVAVGDVIHYIKV